MAILVDTTVLYERENTRADKHAVANRAIERVLAGAYGEPVITDYIFDEAITLALARSGRHDLACTLADRLLGEGGFPEAFTLHPIGEALFEQAVRVFRQYPDQGLSFTDATTVALVERHDIDAVLSFDDDFDGIVERVDPGQV